MSETMILAHFFDHRQSLMQSIQLNLQPDMLEVIFEGNSYPVHKQTLRLEEPFEHAPCILNFSDGSHCEIHDAQDKQALLDYLDYRHNLVERWQKKWYWALLSIVLMIGMLAAARQWGIPIVADKIAARLPVSYERALGGDIMKLLDETMLRPSRLSDQRIAQAEEIIRRLRPASTRVPIHLEVRSGARIGANAFALPGGTVVVTDEMILLITGQSGNELTGVLAEELAAVLAHEIGHVQGNHGMRRLVRDGMVTVIAGSLFSDFSSVVTLASAGIVNREFSREMEVEADSYAIDRLRQVNISPARLADVLQQMEHVHQRANGASSRSRIGQYISSHPATEDRIARFRAAAKQ